MDKNQADAVAQAILGPDLKAQDELRQKRETQAAALVMQRRAAGAALLIGMAMGGAIGHFAFGELSRYLIVGGVVAYLIARLVQRRTGLFRR